MNKENYEITEIVMPYMVMITYNQVTVTPSIEVLMNAIYWRSYQYCELAILKTEEEANMYAHQKYFKMFMSNPYLYGLAEMPLPMAGTYNIQDINFNNRVSDNCQRENEKQLECTAYSALTVAQNVNDNIYWEISAINGYGVAGTVEEMVNMMLYSGLEYPHAVSSLDETRAAIRSRDEYINRFVGRYTREEKINLPERMLNSGEIFTDEEYLEREKRYKENSIQRNLLKVGLF